jgi:hypothetical protein
MESALAYQDPDGHVTRWLETNAYPARNWQFKSAVERLYLTAGTRPDIASRPVDAELLSVRLDDVALDAWRLRPGTDSRLLVAGHKADSPGRAPEVAVRGTSNPPLKMSVRLVPEGGGPAIWEQDRALLEIENKVELRSGMQVPNEAPPGRYGIDVVIYQTETAQGPGAARIARSSQLARIAELEITSS